MEYNQDEERSTYSIAMALVAEVNSKFPSRNNDKVRDDDLANALFTLSEGLDINITVEDAMTMWRLVEYLTVNRLPDEFVL